MNVRAIKELIQHYNLGISPRRLGQHFLVDPKALARLGSQIEAKPEDRVLEIGAGLGALTEELLKSEAVVYAVERDSRFLRVLTDRFRNAANLQFIRSDILKVDLASYAMGDPHSLLVVGNIPYSLTSPILEFLLNQRRWVRRAILTIQKEVADRIVARPGSKVYSSISVFTQAAFRPSIAFAIHPGAFYPQPKVTSAVLRLDPLASPSVPAEDEQGILKLVRAVFSYRRKTLLNALVASGGWGKREEILPRLTQAGIDSTRRPETFSLTEFAALYRSLR